MGKTKFEGSHIKKARDFENEKTESHRSENLDVFTKEVPMVYAKAIKPQNCQGGDLDRCQNACWCAQCVDSTRKETNPFKKTVIGSASILDTEKFLESLPIREKEFILAH